MTAQGNETENNGRRWPGRLVLLRDVASFLFGLALMSHQAFFVPPADFNLWVLLTGGSLVGVPGAAVALGTAREGRGGGSAITTGSAPPPSPEPASQPVQ